VTDGLSFPSQVAAFRGPVACRRTADSLTLIGAAADSADDRLILTFISPSMAEVPDSLAAAIVRAVDEHHYRIASASGDLTIEAASLHVHRDIGSMFYRAVPPRPAPLGKRIFWRIVLALAGTRAGKRLLLSLRRQA
jgi:hypothetical protein